MVFPNVFGPPTMVAAGVDFKDRLVTLFDSDCDDGVSAGIWVIHTYFTKYLFYQTLLYTKCALARVLLKRSGTLMLPRSRCPPSVSTVSNAQTCSGSFCQVRSSVKG